jgi:2-polyprenyl-3-methyl-5-hydroxy-6-metoxy-1,4-benzoquinol methylase
MDFSERSKEYELLDEMEFKIAANDLYKNLSELNFINTHLGGHSITLKGFQKLYKRMGSPNKVSVLEIGSGGGDNLFVLQKFALRNNFEIELVGVDAKNECTNYAQEKYPNIQFVTSLYQNYTPQKKPDIIFNSLFCHHFSDVEIIEILQWMQTNSRMGFFINDLHRHPLAYYTIRLLTRLFSKSYLVKNDAPLSVLRGLNKKEWVQIIKNANLSAKVQWKWAFRYLIYN